MKTRCRNERRPDFKNYGGRGIDFERRWDDFQNFLEDMGEAPAGMTLDRIDNNGHYCKANCRWATMLEQGSNKRNNRWIEHDGRRQTLTQWARELGVGRVTLLKRLQRGLTPAEAFAIPIQARIRSWRQTH
jgi:hypothetical protein